jgi:HK97 family phage major capsid protein
MDAIKAAFAEKFAELTALQAKEALENAPVRRVPGALIGPDGTPIAKSNRYYRTLKALSEDGEARIGMTRVKAVDVYLAGLILSKAHELMPDRVKSPSDDLKAALKALTSDGAGTGDEYVPTNMAQTVWDDMYLASRVAALMQQIPMPTNPFEIPQGLGSVTWRKGRENTSTTPSDAATAKSVLTATELVTEQNWSYTMEEDSVVALMPAHRARLAQSGAEMIDDFALNADATNAATGNINLDDAAPAADTYYLSDGQDGIRHQWLVDNTAQTVNAGGDALIDGDITGTMALMGKYAVDPAKCAIITDVATYLNGFLKLDTVTTFEKFGAGAVVLTGQLASYRGLPIIVSESHRKAEADGKRAAAEASNTLGSFSIVNRSMWYTGFLRDILVEVDRDIQKRQYIMVTSFREAIAAHGTRSTNTHTAGCRNILV